MNPVNSAKTSAATAERLSTSGSNAGHTDVLRESVAEVSKLTEEQWASRYGRWFIHMRWIAIIVTAVLVFFATHGMGVLRESLWRPLSLLVLLLAACNVVYTLLLQRGHAARLLVPQIYVDLILLTALLHYSGGVENPLSLLMVFHVIIAGIMLRRRQCYTVAATASGFLIFLAVAEWAEILHHSTLLTFPHHHDHEGVVHAAHQAPYVATTIAVQTTILFLTAYFVTSLAERVRHDERQLKAMADHAMAERQLLESALETTGTGLRVLDRQLRPYWLNKRWEIWFTGERLANTAVTSVDSSARRTLEDGQVRTDELVLSQPAAPAPDKRTSLVLQLTSAPLHDLAKRITHVVELAQDVTRQREIQAQMVQAGKLAAVGELAGHVAHEVNNPIAIISAKARLLVRDYRAQVPPQVIGELEKVAQQADRVAQIAQGLLSYCRPSTQVKGPLNLYLPISRALALVEQRFAAFKIELQNRMPDQLSLVRANFNEMEQVFFNLFLNAIDAMPHGGILTISAESRVPWLEVSVQDTGTGIPPDIRERIFEPFFSTKEEGRGTGLGLAICAGLIRSHQGAIEVSSELGKGSRFTVKLPLAKETNG